MRRRVDISVDHIVPATRLPSAMCQSSRCPVVASVASTVETARRHQQRQHHDQLAIDRLGHRAGEGAEQELRQLPRRHDARDRQRRAGDLVGEQARRQQLEPAHGIGEGADQPQPQEVRLAQQFSHRGTLVPSALPPANSLGSHAIVADILQPRRITGGSWMKRRHLMLGSLAAADTASVGAGAGGMARQARALHRALRAGRRHRHGEPADLRPARPRPSASRSWSTTRAAPAATSARSSSRAPRPTATRSA